MTQRVVDHKAVDMSEPEYAYYRRIVDVFGSDCFQGLFDADEDGCISFIRPPLGREVPWAVLMFLQNLMLNQHERRRDRILEQRLTEMERALAGRREKNDSETG